MQFGWTHAGPTVAAAFLASLVEFVEALTVVLAVGSVRGWRSALAGSGAALAVLLALIVLLGSALTRVPLQVLQAVVGSLLLLFGLRWLRKAILRSAGILPLHDEAATFAQKAESMRGYEDGGRWDRIALSTAFQITMLEGIEVVFIVIAIGAGGPGLLLPASLGALAALLVVVALGVTIHKPLSQVPENAMKFTVGVLLSAFGTFWAAEGLGHTWPGADWAIAALIVGFLAAGWIAVALCRWCAGRTVTAASRV